MQLPHPKVIYNIQFTMYNENMGKAVPNAFTLVELLVVIAVMAIVGVFTLANYRSFGEDQNLKSASLDIQSLLKQAQTNATANVICNGEFGAGWQVEFANDKKTINLKCGTSSTTQKVVQLGVDNYINISIDSISGVGSGCSSGLSFPVTVNFSTLKGNIDFGVANCNSLTIILKNKKISPDCNGSNLVKCKSLKIDTGGRIYVP